MRYQSEDRELKKDRDLTAAVLAMKKILMSVAKLLLSKKMKFKVIISFLLIHHRQVEHSYLPYLLHDIEFQQHKSLHSKYFDSSVV